MLIKHCASGILRREIVEECLPLFSRNLEMLMRLARILSELMPMMGHSSGPIRISASRMR